MHIVCARVHVFHMAMHVRNVHKYIQTYAYISTSYTSVHKPHAHNAIFRHIDKYICMYVYSVNLLPFQKWASGGG